MLKKIDINNRNKLLIYLCNLSQILHKDTGAHVHEAQIKVCVYICEQTFKTNVFRLSASQALYVIVLTFTKFIKFWSNITQWQCVETKNLSRLWPTHLWCQSDLFAYIYRCILLYILNITRIDSKEIDVQRTCKHSLSSW